jgi:hypothetical protein
MEETPRDVLESESYSYATDSSHSSHSSLSSYSSDIDTLDELLNRFTCKFSPSYVLKLRDQRGQVIYGADITFDEDNKPFSSLALMLKPVDRNFWLRRVRLNHQCDVSVRSRKLTAWVFTLDLEAEVNLISGARDAGFRIATAWDATTGKVRKKSKFHPLDGVHAAVEWGVDYSLPEMKGRFSSEYSAGMETSLGYAHGEVSKLELSLWPRTLIGGDAGEREEGRLLGERRGMVESKPEESIIDKFVRKLNGL